MSIEYGEPLFAVGDWVTDGKWTFEIDSVEEKGGKWFYKSVDHWDDNGVPEDRLKAIPAPVFYNGQTVTVQNRGVVSHSYWENGAWVYYVIPHDDGICLSESEMEASE